WYLLDLPLPPYRTAGFVVALPLLAMLLGPALAMFGRDRGRRIVVAAALIAVGTAAWFASGGADAWAERALTPASDPTVFAQIESVGRYLEGVEGPGP